MRALILASLSLVLGGCHLANRPPDEDPRHLAIAWRADFDAARREAQRLDRPILAVLVGGDITERC